MLKRKNLYFIWTPIYLIAVILAIYYLPNIYEFIFLYSIIFFVLKDFFVDLIVGKGTWPSWSEHLPLSVIVLILWPLGYVSTITGLIALADSIFDFYLDQKS